MNYKIVVDSCCDLPENLRKDKHFVIVPLTLTVDHVDIIDDDTFDQADFIRRAKASKEAPHSACPSPERFAKECECEDTDIYMVTLSSKLSGSHNSATVGRSMYMEEGGKNQVAIIDSESACCGEALIAMKIQEYAESGMAFSEVVEKANAYRDEMKTYFVLETLDTLRKNGRLSNLQAIIANVLSIKPVMGAKKGEIVKLDQTRGINKALQKMCQITAHHVKDSGEKTLAITHCNCPERAEYVKAELLKLAAFKEIIIVKAAGVSTMYANDGGIVVTV